jgi:two-component system response regulator YesN
MIKIAVVDDEERIRLGLAKLIEQCGEDYKVVGCFASGPELLERLNDLQADLIMTDIKMPQMNGLQLIEKVQQRKPKIKFAIVSGFNDFAFARQAIRQGVEDYLLKPVDPSELAELLQRVKNNIEIERYRKEVATEEHIRLLLRNDPDHLPEHMIQGANRDLGQTLLLRDHFAVLLVRAEPDLPADRIEHCMSYWNREYRLVAWEPRHTVIVAAIREGDHADTARELAYTLLQQLPHSSAVRIGVSGIHQGPLKLRDAYVQAELCMQSSWYEPGPKAMADTALAGKRDDSYNPLRLLEKEFRPALHALDFAKAEVAVEEWLGELSKHRPAWQALTEGVSYLFGLIRDEWNERQSHPSGQPDELTVPAPTTFADWPAYKAALSASAKEQLESLKNAKHENRVVETVKSYIQKNYWKEMELQRLADVVYLTPSYLSKLFKTETGETITDYIISVRIERAKELLLKNPSLKTYEVGEQVGYPDPAYFNKVFKKVTGWTPKEFRERVRL